MRAHAPYEYSPLQGQQIRLLTLLPGKLNAPIRVRLDTTILAKGHVPVYEALSYTWGSLDCPIDIFFDIPRGSDQFLPVTQNLGCALQHLRYMDKPRILWIDAVCVNQQDLPERSKQVARMADVYSLAKKVLAWIGPEADNSTYALNTLRDINNVIDVDFFGMSILPSSNVRYSDESAWSDKTKTIIYNTEKFMPIHHLFGRPWFERLWIQQEIRLAVRAILVCGFQTLPWSAFAQASYALNHKHADDRQLGNCAASFKERRRHVSALCTGRAYPGFEDLLAQTKQCKCNDPRDRVYALLGLLDDDYGIVPNYEKSVTEVYQEMFIAFMKKQQPYGNLNLLATCEIWESERGLPSWVPDWSPERKCVPLMNDDACGATGFSNAEALVLDGNVLRVMGMEVGKISRVVHSRLDEASTLTDFVVFIRAMFPRNMLFQAGAEERLDAYCRILCSNYFFEMEKLPDREKSKESLRMVLQVEGGKEMMLSEDTMDYLNQAFTFVRRRTLFSTMDGEIGLGPPAAAAEDVIAVVPGCSSPMVLRPVYTAERSVEVPAQLHDKATTRIYLNPVLKGYKVIGECHLDKLMMGAAILGRLPEDYEVISTFVQEENGFFHAYLNRRSGKVQFEDPRFEKLRSERDSNGTRRVVVREGPIPGVEETIATHARRGSGIRMRVSGLDDEEEMTCVTLQFLSKICRCEGSLVTTEAVKVEYVILFVNTLSIEGTSDFGKSQCSIDATGKPLTEEALESAIRADACLLGAIGGPKWGTGPIRPEQGLLTLRKSLNTFGNLRPCSFASPSLIKISPLKEDVCRNVSFTVVRELTGGIYFGTRKEADESSPDEAWDTEVYSKTEIERITRLAGFMATKTSPPQKIWSLDKANVLATSRLWRKTVTEVLDKEFPGVPYEHQLIDSAAMIMVKEPTKLNGVIVTSNLFGDIISDEASVIPGSLGLLPSASLAGIPDGKSKCNGIYEPIHGSAPDLAGKGLVNPIAAILSVAMMLQYSFNLPDEAKAVEEAVKRTIESGVNTNDIGGSASTKEVGDKVAEELGKILQGTRYGEHSNDAMLLRYSLNLAEETKAVETAVRWTIKSGFRTKDVNGRSTTAHVGDATATTLDKILSIGEKYKA
ncbi:MAG: hypothetical protein Q9214_002074 [Letrouitia sp. 1 TL-2023]